MDFYERVKLTVKAQKSTIESLCLAIKIKLSTYNNLRQNQNLPRLDQAMAIADQLNVSLEWLAYGDRYHYKSKLEQVTARQQEIMSAITNIDDARLESVVILVNGLLEARANIKKERSSSL